MPKPIAKKEENVVADPFSQITPAAEASVENPAPETIPAPAPEEDYKPRDRRIPQE